MGLANIVTNETSLINVLTNKPLIHRPEAGLNPIVDAAAYLFSMMGKLKFLKNHHSLEKLHQELMIEIVNFQETVQTYHVSAEYLAEYIPLTCYAMCMTLDDIILNTPWGHENWNDYRLVFSFSDEPLTHENFIIILERLVRDPDIYIDVMEFIYICLSLGMGFKYYQHVSTFNHEQLDQILHSLYKRIRACRGNFNKVLSPFSIKTSSVAPKINHKNKTLKNMFNYFYKLNRKIDLSHIGNPHSLSKKILHLENRLFSIIKFLKNKTIQFQGKKIELNNLPWFLLISGEKSGKTTLLANSGIKYILNKKIKFDQLKLISTTENCDWWVTSNTVMIDVPGRYTSYDENNNTDPNKLFQHLLDSIYKLRGENGVDGVIIAISVTELLDSQGREKLINQLKYQFSCIKNKFGTIPIYFSITKCDLLPGFVEFFNDYGSDELTQAWGVSIPPLNDNESMLDVFVYRFNKLIKRLNEQLIWRLHQERNPFAKTYIKDFPLQVERCQQALVDIFKKLSQENMITIKGVYLNSAIQQQEEEEVALSKNIVVMNTQQSLAILQNPATPVQSFFIKQFLLHGLNGGEPKTQKRNRKSIILIALSLSYVVIAAVFAYKYIMN